MDQPRTPPCRAARGIAATAVLAVGLLFGTATWAQSPTPAPPIDESKLKQSSATVPPAQRSTSDQPAPGAPNQSGTSKKINLHCNDPANSDCW
jgi:hypothetical protein